MASLDHQETYTIHEVAQRSRLSIPALRYYEEIGFVPDMSSGH
ncbi:MerR family DNA-binding transcriptional regulator [Dictyobacter alpinus]